MDNIINSFKLKPKDYKNYIQEYKESYAKRVQVVIFLIFLLSCTGYLLAHFSYKNHFLKISTVIIV